MKSPMLAIEKQKRNTETGDATHARAEQKLGGKAEAMPHKQTCRVS